MKHKSLILIAIAFAVLASLYSFVVPLGEGPDEPGHAAYVFFLAREGRLPIQRAAPGASDVPGEGHQPPLAYALAAPLVAWLPPEGRRFDLPGNPRFTWNGGNEPNAAAHGSRERWPWRGEVLAWHLARLASVMCGAVAVVFTYLAARDLRDQRPKTKDQSGLPSVLGPSSLVPLLAAALVAFNPQFLFTAGLVTNDTLLVALSAAMLWLVARGPTMDDGWRTTGDQSGSSPSILALRPSVGAGLALSRPIVHAIVIGILLGLALITKQSALLLAPVALLSVLEHSWRAARNRDPGRSNVSLPPAHLVILSQLVLFLGITLAVSGWWYARNWRLYGDPFGLAAFQAEFATQAFDAASAAAWLDALKQLHSSFWARFGWMNVRPPPWVIWFYLAVEAVSLAGLLRLAWSVYQRDEEIRRQGSRETRGQPAQVSNSSDRPRFPVLPFSHALGRLGNGGWALLALPLLGFAWVASFALAAGLVAWQGRLLFPALPAIAILLALGVQNVASRVQKRFASVAHFTCYILLFALIAVSIWLPFGVIRPAYPWEALSEQAALERLGTPIYGRLGKPGDPGAEVRGWRFAGDARPGAALELALMWHARGRQNRDWTVFVHLVDARDVIVAEDNRQPRDGAFPMGQWVAGDWVEDRHPLLLPADLPPGPYRLRAGLWDPATDERAAVFNQKGKLIGDYLEVGVISVSSE